MTKNERSGALWLAVGAGIALFLYMVEQEPTLMSRITISLALMASLLTNAGRAKTPSREELEKEIAALQKELEDV